jgi:hypothetical protein
MGGLDIIDGQLYMVSHVETAMDRGGRIGGWEVEGEGLHRINLKKRHRCRSGAPVAPQTGQKTRIFALKLPIAFGRFPERARIVRPTD